MGLGVGTGSMDLAMTSTELPDEFIDELGPELEDILSELPLTKEATSSVDGNTATANVKFGLGLPAIKAGISIGFRF